MTILLTKTLVTLLALLLGACASSPINESKFAEHRVADLSAFADNTMVIMQTPAGALNSTDAILSEEYLLKNPEEIARLDALTEKGDALFSHIRTYSARISDLSVRDLPEEQRIAAVAESLQVFANDIEGTDEHTLASYAHTIESVRAQQEFLVAIRSAQPIISVLGRIGQSYLNEYDNIVLGLADVMKTSLDSDFEPVLDYFNRLDSRNRVLADRLRDVYKRETSLGALAAEEEQIIEALERNHRLAQEAGTEYQLYVATAAEIARLQEASLTNTGGVRVSILSWVSAHDKMASGEVMPADWFSLNDVATAAFMAGRRIL